MKVIDCGRQKERSLLSPISSFEYDPRGCIHGLLSLTFGCAVNSIVGNVKAGLNIL